MKLPAADAPRPIIDRPALSPLATSVWSELARRNAYSQHSAVRDRILAETLGTHPRMICDAARELLAAGTLVLAGTDGRWIGNVQQALAYRHSLRRRAVQVFLRARAVQAGISQHQRQGSLFTDLSLNACIEPHRGGA